MLAKIVGRGNENSHVSIACLHAGLARNDHIEVVRVLAGCQIALINVKVNDGQDVPAGVATHVVRR